MTRRTKPYTAAGLARMKCAAIGCNNRAIYQFEICADGNNWRPVCAEHDAKINEAVMRVIYGKTREAEIKRYRTEVLGL